MSQPTITILIALGALTLTAATFAWNLFTHLGKRIDNLQTQLTTRIDNVATQATAQTSDLYNRIDSRMMLLEHQIQQYISQASLGAEARTDVTLAKIEQLSNKTERLQGQFDEVTGTLRQILAALLPAPRQS